MKTGISLFLILAMLHSQAQEKPYYYEIPLAPDSYSAASVVARMVDGLGFRYYWATEGLREKDLAFRPSDSARTLLETLEHIQDLTSVLLNTVSGKPNDQTSDHSGKAYEEIRAATLNNIRLASEILKKPGVKPEELPMVFIRQEGNRSFPFWNLINGPLSDALWHVGQVVSFRRSAGNPLPEGVNVLSGQKN